jgi:integrase
MNVDQLPSGRWRVRVSHEGRRASGTAETRHEAQVLGGKLLANLGKVNDDEQTLGAFLLWHVKKSAKELQATTVADYERVVCRFLMSDHRLVDYPAVHITTGMLVQLYDDLAEDDWSAHRVLRLHGVISGAYTRAVTWDLIDRNPALKAGPKPPAKPDLVMPTAEQVAQLLDACDGEFHAALTLLVVTGMRRGEVVGLKWADLDLDAGTAKIKRAVSYTKATGVVVRDTVKNGKKGERVVALDEGTVAVLKAYRKEVIEFHLAIGHPFADDWVFTNHKTGGPRRPDWATQRFVRMRTALKLEHVRLYDLRHFMVTSMLAAGMAPSTGAGRAGHDVKTMLQTYTHFLPASDRAEAEAFAATIQAARRKQAR